MWHWLLILSVFLGLCGSAHACWQQIPPDTFARSAPVIVVGKVTRVIEPAAKGDRLLDTAVIQVDEVIKNALTDVKIEKGKTVEARMSSLKSTSNASTDIDCPAGRAGMWLLYLDKGGFRLDVHPVQLQRTDDPTDQFLKRLTKHLKDNPPDGMTREKWLKKQAEKEKRQ